jgi:hypothetical protein
MKFFFDHISSKINESKRIKELVLQTVKGFLNERKYFS